MNIKSILVLVGVGVLLIALLVALFWGFDAAALTLNGWIALGLGVVFSLAIGIGLMALVFYSARRGYDEGVARDEPDDLD